MEKPVNEKNCKNCKFFSQHYTKQGSRFHNVCCGHCLNRNNKKMIPLNSCGYWENVEIQKEERKRSITETLEFMAERLNEIAMILEDDKNS